MRRKILPLFMAVWLILTCCVSVLADTPDREETGAISVTLKDKSRNQPLVGAELNVYYVASAEWDAGGNLAYTYTEAFKQLDTAMDDVNLAPRLDSFLAKNAVPALTAITDEAGTAVWEGLPLGLYFVRQTGSVEGFAPCTPFVVTVPAKTDTGYVYTVDASPKTEVERLVSITIRKVWNTDAATKATDKVTVQLLRDGQMVKTATLNEKNGWQVTYTAMPASDAYSVKEVDVPKGFTATYKQDEYVFTVTNTSTLVQTGQLLWPIPALAAAGMLLLAVGIALLRKKGNKHG